MSGTSGRSSSLSDHRQPKPHMGRRMSDWGKKYFMEGQSLTAAQQRALDNLKDDSPWYEKLYVKHKRIIGFILPASFFHFFYWAVMIERGWLFTFTDKWYLSVTMIIGSMIAGMTCAGGGAVAFPVMTLAFSVSPSVARDVSLMIQSCGMSCASFTIFFMKVQIEHLTLGLCFTSAIAGTIFGLHVIDPLMDPPVKKMVFVSMWFAFAFVLYLLNRDPNRTVYNKIQDVRPWKVAVLLLTGFIGGIFSAWAGSGLDLCVFSVVTTLFRLSEKIATPTSVILMASNSIVTIFWRAMVLGDVELEAWQFISVTAPIVTVGAPFGSLIGSHFHREVLAAALYIITTVSLIGAFVIVDQTVLLGCLSAGVMITSCSIFMGLTHAGKKLYLYTEQKQLGEKNLKELKALENGSKFHLNGNGVNPSVSAFEDIREEPICVVSTATKF